MGLAQGQHGVIDDKAGVLQLVGVCSHGADAAALGHGVEHAVAAVLTAAHDKVADEHLTAIGGHCHCNAAAGVLVGGQIIVQVDLFHVKFSYYGTPPVACGDSPLGEGGGTPSGVTEGVFTRSRRCTPWQLPWAAASTRPVPSPASAAPRGCRRAGSPPPFAAGWGRRRTLR